MGSARAALVDATHRLTQAGVPSPAVDAELLLAHVLDVPRGNLILTREITEQQQRDYNHVVEQRCRRRPLQHIVGSAGFRRLTLAVGPGVFVPRPETELLVEIAVRHLRSRPAPHRVWDLCAGSGAISLSIATEVDGCEVSAVELSADALPWLQRNVDAHTADIAARGSSLTVIAGDATTSPLESKSARGAADLVATNPPYIPDDATPIEPEVTHYEPSLALYGGPDGLDVVRVLSSTASALLRPGGLLLIEHADVQGEANPNGVPALLRAQVDATGAPVWGDVHDYKDLAGKPRVTAAVRTTSEASR